MSFHSLVISFFRRLTENLNVKSQEEQALNNKLYELGRENIVLTTQSQEVCCLFDIQPKYMPSF